LAIVYSALGRDEEAIEELQRAIEIKPDWPTLHSTLSMVYRYLGRYEKAVEALQRAIDLEPDNMEYRDELTELLQKLEFGDGSD
jgi:tetratricopeptide (TPR) repeat protein